MEYEIRDDIPIPPIRSQIHKWPFKNMQVGQSLDVHFDQDWTAAVRAAQSLGKRKGWRFSVRWYKYHKDLKGNPAPFGRIWRIK